MLDFLTTIQNGVPGKIYIEGGDFSAVGGRPDVYVIVTQGKQVLHRTEVKTAKKPKCGEGISYTWNIDNVPLMFEAWDDDWGDDTLLLKQQVNVSGFFGYKNLTDTLRNNANGCRLDIRFSWNIPNSPWQ